AARAPRCRWEQCCGGGRPCPASGGPAPGACRRRRRRSLDGRGGRTVVAHTRGARAARAARRLSAQRLNQPRPALVEAHADGAPSRVNRQQVALVREEWRVVDRWWTDE